jgi:alkylhydroperoxidase/carboxymuconolactone decarboxylase family protein YurZ
MDATEFKVKALLDATGQSPDLTDREKHLVGLAVSLTRGCSVCSGGRIEKALDAGIGYETIRATIDLAAAVNAGVTIRTAIEGAARNNIAAACSGDECTAGTPS